MTMNNLFLLHCVVSANVRQSTAIHFDDLKLPDGVIETLKERRAVSIRPSLSLKLKEFLSSLRMQQRYLYQDCCIHKGDIHFLHADFFEEAKTRIEKIRNMAAEFNQELWELWEEEFETWSNSVSNVLEPIFQNDSEGFEIAREAYLKMFPSREQFKDSIEVFVVGPSPVSFEEATSAQDHPLCQEISQAASLNTMQVLEAARESAADRAMLKASELLDDLDVRIGTKVGDRQVGTDNRRGSWEVAAQELILISTYCPDFKDLALLAESLHVVAKELNNENASIKQKSETIKKYERIKSELRNEMQRIVDSRDSSEGYEALQKSLALSNSYKDLISQIQSAETVEQLTELQASIQTEVQVFEHRARQLNKLYKKKEELIKVTSMDLDEIIEEVKNMNVEQLSDVDF